jgi:hypothetical protein
VVDTGIPNRVKAFVAGQIDSVVRLEILLLLRERAVEEFSAEGVAAALRIDPAWAAPHLSELRAQGLLTCTDGAVPRYRYGPGSDELREVIDELARCYAERRVSMTALIFSKPPDALRSFADAFRLRKDRTEGSDG